MKNQDNRRILLVDDNEDIHRDFLKILTAKSTASGAMSDAEDALFGDEQSADDVQPSGEQVTFEVQSAMQGQAALEMVEQAVAAGEPFALAFVDMRMPPGWDGIETIQRLWEADSDLQVVICTAFADYTWAEMVASLGCSDRLLILKKPFDAIEVSQLALALTEKWNTTRRMRAEMDAVEHASKEVRAYAASLETVNTALMQAKVLAQAAASERSEFLASVTGGILDPMTELVDRAEAIRSLEEGDDSWAMLLDEVCADGGRLAGSLQDALDLAEMEAGTLVLNPGPCSPGDLAEAVCARYAERALAKGLTLTLERAPTTPDTLESDGPRLERVLDHLIGNAVAYTTAGSVTVSVRGESGARGRASFSIVDTGAGLSTEAQANLFKSFCHSSQDAEVRRGTGLGLSLSKRLARALGGELDCQSSPAGTRVTFSISAVFARVN